MTAQRPVEDKKTIFATLGTVRNDLLTLGVISIGLSVHSPGVNRMTKAMWTFWWNSRKRSEHSIILWISPFSWNPCSAVKWK